MKIRTDFVTNSSSSSFILIGNSVELGKINITDGNYIAIGEYLGDGIDVIDLNQEIYDYILANEMLIKLNSEDSDFEFYRVYKTLNNDWNRNQKLTIKELAEVIEDVNTPFEIREVDKDYHCSNNINDIKERYYKEKKKFKF